MNHVLCTGLHGNASVPQALLQYAWNHWEDTVDVSEHFTGQNDPHLAMLLLASLVYAIHDCVLRICFMYPHFVSAHQVSGTIDF